MSGDVERLYSERSSTYVTALVSEFVIVIAVDPTGTVEEQ